jgi:DNA invertase Pin-like site-specific DNA recombinase
MTRAAYVYLRQSSLGQVKNNRESTERQYALKDKAVDFGWGHEQVRTLDRDLGRSGSQSAGREDFQVLVSDVSQGKVGAIFVLEASRLARSSLDWQRLIRICSITQTLVVDEDGCYDPGDFNDALLLGLKGTIAQAELHYIHARLQGGLINKAKKGELRRALPIGFRYEEDGRVVTDPDREVQASVRLAFAAFRQTGSALGVVRHFRDQGLRFPKRAYGGARDGELLWSRLTHCRVLNLLKNPTYAGVYVYGRMRRRREVAPDGTLRSRLLRVPRSDWLVTIPDRHEGYVSWQDFLENQDILDRNRNGKETAVRGSAREGVALLQGLLLCARCGRRVRVMYDGRDDPSSYYCKGRVNEGVGAASCMSVRSKALDAAISERVLEVLVPTQVDVAFEALRQLEENDTALCRQRQLQVERAEYEAQLAERRYQEVDPANRLVAATLERRWNEALAALEEQQRALADFCIANTRTATEEQRARLLALATDFPRLWSAPTTSPKDRKRLLRVLVKDITLQKFVETREVVLRIRWQGGVCEDLRIAIVDDRRGHAPEVVTRVRELAANHRDPRIADMLNSGELQSRSGEPFTWSTVAGIRKTHGIPVPNLRCADELTVSQVARRFGVKRRVVHQLIKQGSLQARRVEAGSAYWITLDPAAERKLTASAEALGRRKS